MFHLQNLNWLLQQQVGFLAGIKVSDGKQQHDRTMAIISNKAVKKLPQLVINRHSIDRFL